MTEVRQLLIFLMIVTILMFSFGTWLMTVHVSRSCLTLITEAQP